MKKKFFAKLNIFVAHIDNQKGFTLMEWIMVVVVLSILMSMALIKYSGIM